MTRDVEEMLRDEEEMEPDLDEVKRHLPQKGGDFDTWLRIHVPIFLVFQTQRIRISEIFPFFVISEFFHIHGNLCTPKMFVLCRSCI